MWGREFPHFTTTRLEPLLARSPSKKSALTTNPTLVRQARRLTRQQRKLEQELMATSEYTPTQMHANTKNRSIKLGDVKEIEPKTETQEDFFEAYYDVDALALTGSAGTGKSFISLYLALLDVLDPETPFDKIIILRSIVPTRDIGFLPGDKEKLEPYEAPYQQIFSELVGRKDAYDKLKDMGLVEFECTSFLRGVTFNNAIVIVDEFQSMNWHEIKTVCTRVGKDSKLLFIGDGNQDDLLKNKNDVSGFNEFMQVVSRMPEFRQIKFTRDDIVRSGFVRSFIIAAESVGL